MLHAKGISVAFGGNRVVDDVDLLVRPGAVTGLIGPNGAGKTTVFNVMSGFQRPDSGRIELAATDVTRYSARRRARLGLCRTFQRPELFGSLTARENVIVALEAHGVGESRRQRVDRADALLARVGLGEFASATASVLSTGICRLLELARALACDPKVLLLDEASSGLNDAESARLGEVLKELAEDGVGVLLVEHDVDLVMRVCTRIYVLDFGKIIAVGTPDEIRSDRAVRGAYLGQRSTAR